ncbi:aromatic-ring-hydroxylating dioxygenase subunit beta [Limnohabitans sp.]|jgi:anthranilate 1,2-dioxygenase small subunit|uniref:aromatic-ring-hydroxylating dioxygenase subunit beta n=1 Tax=Limnohabitans sp. TaxID=1907725 RepID=UPI0038B8984E
MKMYAESHHRAVENLIYEWARLIDEDQVEAVTQLLQDDGRYTVQSKFNRDRQLPMAIIDAHSAAQLRDRIMSMRIANIYQPHHYRHIISGVQIVGLDGDVLQVRSNYLVIRTMDLDGDMKVFSTGQCQDEVVITPEGPRFKSRRFVYDSRIVETLLVIPL